MAEKLCNEVRGKLLANYRKEFVDFDEDEKILELNAFVDSCNEDSHLPQYDGEDMPEDIECVRGSRKVSEEQFYALCF